MSAFVEEKERRIVPRWRDSLTTVATGELAPLATLSPAREPERDFLESKLADWQWNRTIAFATDLVGAAFVLGRAREATHAAEFILANPRLASAPARHVAHRILGTSPANEEQDEQVEAKGPTQDSSRRMVRSLRLRLREEPRNPLMWVDLARHYAILGLGDKSAQAMSMGVRLAPNSRFIIRSATRLHVHLGDPEHALHLLRRAEATKHDPWLVAAEIAVTSIVGRSPRSIKDARDILARWSMAPSQTSELASALATLELAAGNNRKARKLFSEALIEPTDNSVAQAEWASRRLSDFRVETRHLEAPWSFEARTWDHFAAGQWSAALLECERWLSDEPFSSRPAMVGTFVSGVALEDYASSIRLARLGLMANSDDQTLLNNLASALASTGDVEEASKVYQSMDPRRCDDGTYIAWLATGGLISFRRGFPERGRQLYREAIDTAGAPEHGVRKAMAVTFLAREEAIASSPYALSAFEMALRECAGKDAPALLAMRRLLDRLQDGGRKL